MDGFDTLGDGSSSPPSRLFERLAQIPGYTWDQSIKPYHSSYDNWHVFGIQHGARDHNAPSPVHDRAKSTSSRSSHNLPSRPVLRHAETSNGSANDRSSAQATSERTYTPVVARVSSHILRLEREYHLSQSFTQSSDPEYKHTVRLIELVKLPSRPGDSIAIVSIFESPGRDYLQNMIDFGPTWSPGFVPGSVYELSEHSSADKISLASFLDFAIGACECLELLHELRIVHGDIRGDAFYFDEKSQENAAVKLINFGAGPRSFENGFTSAGWLALTKEAGVQRKLQFIAPEQTGRMPAEPDSRTDIYSLGVLLWTLVTKRPAFYGDTPLDIIQAVLARRKLPAISSIRMDIPKVIEDIVQKMTRKQIDERYHSTTGLKYDLLEVRKLLQDGNTEALAKFVIGLKDVSSFFVLPTLIFGRMNEQDKILKVIEKVYKRRREAPLNKRPPGPVFNVSSALTMSDGRKDILETEGKSSTNSSDAGEEGGRVQTRSSSINAETRALQPQIQKGVEDIRAPSKPLIPSTDSTESLAISDTSDLQSKAAIEGGSSELPYKPVTSSILRETNRSGRRRCEVVTIVGAAGLGKSSLIQSTQSWVRGFGYYASAKFDQAIKVPFEPLLRVLGSLFRQIFSEGDVNTSYHNSIRDKVNPLWPTLCSMLDLPENLMSSEAQQTKEASDVPTWRANKNSGLESSESAISANAHSNTRVNLISDSANIKNGSAKVLSIFVEVVRVLSAKLICLCLDDLQFADEESFDLLSNIMSRKLGIVLIVSYRAEEMLPHSMKSIFESGSVNVTKITLAPMGEQQVIEYTAATLYRSKEYVMPLAMVCFQKTNGNPFDLRQMFETCHRKGCLWYSWKCSAWEYDIDKVLSEFDIEGHGQGLNLSFITRRLQDLPPTARAILAWASLLGSNFSFLLVQRLLSGEFEYDDGQPLPADLLCLNKPEIFTRQPKEHLIDGLQASLQSYILVTGSGDDEFSFSHDRYVQAAAELRECADVEKMHFIIVQTIMKYPLGEGGSSLYVLAEHICQAANLIKRRTKGHRCYRDVLVQAAKKAIGSGARPTALQYYEITLRLMQQDPWDERVEDVFYEETLDSYIAAAELCWHQGRYPQAHGLLESVFRGARTAADKAPAWIIQSRIQAEQGNISATFTSLKASLVELGFDIANEPSWETCDEEFKSLQSRLESSHISDLIEKPFGHESSTVLIGTVITEAISAAYWSDALLFYQLVIKTVDFHQRRSGTFTQSGLAFGYLASIGIARFGDLSFASRMQNISEQLMRRTMDSFTLGRGLAISAFFVLHVFIPVHKHLDIFSEAMEHSLACGDKHVFLFSAGCLALSRLYLGADMVETESACDFSAEGFGDWTTDTRGGVILTAVRQTARALQGKTLSCSAETVMSDHTHNSNDYLRFISSHASNADRPRCLYLSLLIIPLYYFGHYGQAIKTGDDLARSVNELWSVRNHPLALFYLSLSMIAWIRENPDNVNCNKLLERAKRYQAQIKSWQGECNVNYLMWSLMLDAEIYDLEEKYHESIQAYEAAVDHTILNDFVLDQALATELQAGFYIRRGAKRAAHATLLDAIATYYRINAIGKAEQLKTNHEWILRSVTPVVRAADIGTQTMDFENTQFQIEENDRQETRNLGSQTAGDRTKAWVGPGSVNARGNIVSEPSVATLGLDILDLQSILETNQVISSELQIERLLAQMTEIILESAGAQADFACVVVEGEGGWCIAASGTAGNISSEVVPLSEIQDEAQKQILLYMVRFRETVFVHNIGTDERFCNHPRVKSVIALPIIRAGDLLGILYLEGQPNSFTDRNLSVLRLLCSQVAISIANALLFRRIGKVSASNLSMLESQKRALAQAREAEAKAKLAEAEALENVKLKEEAAKAKSIFLANVSHELRTPLNGVIGMSELLKATALSYDQDSYANSIRVCADTLLTVINDILDYSRLEAGKMKLFSVPLNLKDTIIEVVRALSYTNLERGLETIEDLELDPKTLVMGDPVRLHQIFMNLLSNSYKFTPKGSVTVMSRVEHEDDEKIKVRFSVADSGIGISQEQVARLFKPFSQADNSTQRSYGGSGLGLSICKSLIGFLGGRIWLESQVGVGTTVSFTLPFEKAAKGASIAEAETSAKDPDPMATWSSDEDGTSLSVPPTPYFHDLTEIPRDQIRVCIAEDNPINQKIAVAFVAKLGIRCEAFSDGLQAVEALRRQSSAGQPFHIVLMDVQMPVLDGYDATRLVRKDDDPNVRNVIIIAMTASAIRGDREKCLEAGMNNYLAKPVRSVVLKSMLESYLIRPSTLTTDLQERAVIISQNDFDKSKQPSGVNNQGSTIVTHADPQLDSAVYDGFSESLSIRSRDDGNGGYIRPPYPRNASSSDSTKTVRQNSFIALNGDVHLINGSAKKAR